MNKRILLGVGTDPSPSTQHALRVTSELLEQSSPDVLLVLLHVIPIPYDTKPAWGKSPGAMRAFSPTVEERIRAEQVLQRARGDLRQRGIAPEHILLLQRAGTPADEIVRAARELYVDYIVIGSHESSLLQGIRRAIAGSTSRRVLRFAPCPVLLAIAPKASRSRKLMAWYKEAVTRSLSEHPGCFMVFTASDVAQTFVPPNRNVGSKELDAATRALEELARDGALCCHSIKGELRYIND